MAAVPGAVVEIAAKAREAWLQRFELGEGGHGAPHAGVEIGVRASPVRAEKAIRAIVRDGQRMDFDGPERVPKVIEGGKDRTIDGYQGGEVLVGEPEARRGGIPGEENDSAPRHSLELGEAVLPIRPVMDGEHGERGGEGAVAKWQMGRRSLDHGRAASPALQNHAEGGLDRHHGTVGRFVGTGSRADIEHGVRVAEGARDRGGEARVGTAIRAVAAPIWS